MPSYNPNYANLGKFINKILLYKKKFGELDNYELVEKTPVVELELEIA